MLNAVPPFKSVKQSLNLPDGSHIVVCEVDDVFRQIPQAEYARNLFRIDASGQVLWRVPLARESYPHCFLDVRQDDEGRLIASNFDSWDYEVDIDSGRITKHAFFK